METETTDLQRRIRDLEIAFLEIIKLKDAKILYQKQQIKELESQLEAFAPTMYATLKKLAD